MVQLQSPNPWRAIQHGLNQDLQQAIGVMVARQLMEHRKSRVHNRRIVYVTDSLPVVEQSSLLVWSISYCDKRVQSRNPYPFATHAILQQSHVGDDQTGYASGPGINAALTRVPWQFQCFS